MMLYPVGGHPAAACDGTSPGLRWGQRQGPHDLRRGQLLLSPQDYHGESEYVDVIETNAGMLVCWQTLLSFK